MKRTLLPILTVFILSLIPFYGRANNPVLEVVASFPNQQVTGVAVSREGRLFVNFPDWSDNHSISVAEVMKDGTFKPFPDDAWNRPEGAPDRRWICVQSVFVDDENVLWVIDAASPKMQGPVPGGAKLVRCDLATNTVVQVIPFGEDIAPHGSYLNDVRVETRTGHAFLTDSGLGALISVDLRSGVARRLLANDPATKAEPDVALVFEGIPLLDPKTGQPQQIHSDGLALDREHGYVYFHALTGRTLYRVKSSDLTNEQLKDSELAGRVEKVAITPAPDGMLAGPDGMIYLTALEKSAVVRWNADHLETVVEDERLQWPDSMSWGPDGALYVTASQIQLMPKYHHGQSHQRGPFCVFRVKLEQAGARAATAR